MLRRPATLTGVADAKQPWWQIGKTPTLGFLLGGIWTVQAVLGWGDVATGETGWLGGMPMEVVLAISFTAGAAFALTSAVRLRRRLRAERDEPEA